MEPQSPQRHRAFETPNWEDQAPSTTTSPTESRSGRGNWAVFLPVLVFVAIVVSIALL